MYCTYPRNKSLEVVLDREIERESVYRSMIPGRASIEKLPNSTGLKIYIYVLVHITKPRGGGVGFKKWGEESKKISRFKFHFIS